MVELRIPLKSLRFPNEDAQTWGINVARHVERSGYESSWAPISQDRSNRLAQAGRLVGLEGLDRGLFLEVNPVVTGRLVGQYDEDRAAFVRGHARPDFGLNATYGVTSNLTLDATYNPDFSQVEADAGQVAVNERFALFFPEKRPFFLEGTEIFDMPTRLVYTRRIGNPIGGAKLTGKVGATSLGYLGAVDDPADGPNAVFDVVRLRRDVGDGYAGLLYTDRTESAGVYNRVAAADARLLFGGRYTLQLVAAGSLDRDSLEARPLGGSLLLARLSRSGRAFSFDARVTDVAPNFATASGFIRRTDNAQARGSVRLRRYGGQGDLVEDWGPSLQVQRNWSHAGFWRGGGATEGEIGLDVSAGLRGNVFVSAGVQRRFYDYDPADYAGLYVGDGAGALRAYIPATTRYGGLWGASFDVSASSLGWLRSDLHVDWGRQPIFAPGGAAPARPAVALARSLSVRGGLTLQPTPAAAFELDVQHAELFRVRGGGRYSSATIPRLRVQYQFTRALHVRLLGEYSAQETNGLRDPGTGMPLIACDDDGACEPIASDPSNRFHIEALFAYEPSPGSVFYAGYSRDMTEPSAFGFGPLATQLDGLFVKLSYRYRL